MAKIIELVNRFVWGVPALVLIIGVGVYLSICTGFIQFRLFPKACKLFLNRFTGGKSNSEGVSPYQALCTALAATVGTGNLAGVAGAIAIGGPGAVFWMWICAFLGMVTKFAEATLAIRYRERNASGEWVGGPMYMIHNGMGNRWSWLAGLYCFFGVVAAFGVGNATQINAVIGGINSIVLSLNGQVSPSLNLAVGLFFAVLILLILLGGAARIGRISESIVPFAAVFYLLIGVTVLIVRADALPSAIYMIVQGAFSPQAVTGGMIGSAIQSLRVGASRGVFTNEAGMGTASIAHGSAQVDHPVEQGLMGIMEVFIDTIVICTMTALVILCSGVPIPYGNDVGIMLTTEAFADIYGSWIHIPITLSLCCFAVATILGWGLYGARCAQYLLGEKAWKYFVILQAITVVIGAALETKTIWILAETVNGLMAIPNLIVLVFLSPELIRLVKEYKIYYGRKSAYGGTYENINQCKPLLTVTYAKISSPCGSGRKRSKKDLSSECRTA